MHSTQYGLRLPQEYSITGVSRTDDVPSGDDQHFAASDIRRTNGEVATKLDKSFISVFKNASLFGARTNCLFGIDNDSLRADYSGGPEGAECTIELWFDDERVADSSAYAPALDDDTYVATCFLERTDPAKTHVIRQGGKVRVKTDFFDKVVPETVRSGSQYPNVELEIRDQSANTLIFKGPATWANTAEFCVFEKDPRDTISDLNTETKVYRKFHLSEEEFGAGPTRIKHLAISHFDGSQHNNNPSASSFRWRGFASVNEAS